MFTDSSFSQLFSLLHIEHVIFVSMWSNLTCPVSASEAFFDNLTVEQEFMTGVDTDKVFIVFFFLLGFFLFYDISFYQSKSCVDELWFCRIWVGLTKILRITGLLQVNTYIEDCIAQKDPLIKILRLVCMQSVCNNGLKQKVLDFYKREIIQVEAY